MGENAVLVQDNARPHTAYVVQDYLEQESIEIIDWPARSTDLNCIEHMWDIVYCQVSGSHNTPPPPPPPPPAPRNVQELEIAVVRAWNNLPQQQIQNLVQSMPNRCRECLDAYGGYTHYYLGKFIVNALNEMDLWRSSKMPKTPIFLINRHIRRYCLVNIFN